MVKKASSKISFSERVYELCKKIPSGKVSTYKKLANALGTKSYRAVGNALNKNKDPDNIPCFKIINSDGKIGGYSNGLKEKIKRLEKDEIKIENNKVDLKKYLCKL